MSDPQHHIRIWMQTELDRLGHGAKGDLARHLGVRADAITRMTNTAPDRETREIKAHEIIAMQDFFGSVPPGIGEAAQPRTVKILGKAGAGPDGSVLFAEADSDFGEVEAPINATPSTSALEVDGPSMRDIAHDGSLIFYDDRETPSPRHMENLCICWLEDGRVVIKYPHPGRAPGLFDLESTNAPWMRDVPVRHMAFVTGIIPRIAARRLIRSRPDLHYVDQVVSR